MVKLVADQGLTATEALMVIRGKIKLPVLLTEDEVVSARQSIDRLTRRRDG